VLGVRAPPALALNEEHHEILQSYDDPESEVNYKPPEEYATDPGTYVEQIEAMSVGGIHLHSMTPEEAYHAARGTDWDYETVYRELAAAGLDSAPGTAAEILVDEVRDVICPGKIRTDDWVAAMEGAMAAGLDVTSTMMYGHVETVEHRAKHLGVIRDLQDRTGRITEFVPSPLSTRTRPSTATALSTPAPLTTRTNSWWRSRASSWTTSITCRPRG